MRRAIRYFIALSLSLGVAVPALSFIATATTQARETVSVQHVEVIPPMKGDQNIILPALRTLRTVSR